MKIITNNNICIISFSYFYSFECMRKMIIMIHIIYIVLFRCTFIPEIVWNGLIDNYEFHVIENETKRNKTKRNEMNASHLLI